MEVLHNQYINGSYRKKHPDWHFKEAANKCIDLQPSFISFLKYRQPKHIKVADIGAGAGGVLHETTTWLKSIDNELSIEPIAFEISPAAVSIAKERFPDLDMRKMAFEDCDENFDLVLFVDVLEHLENPWAMLRQARQKSKFMIVRQPLLENFSTFRHSNYAYQRQHWGHITYFNYDSFLDMASACGWEALDTNLVPSWELSQNLQEPKPLIPKLLTRANKRFASYWLSGFYLNGIFK